MASGESRAVLKLESPVGSSIGAIRALLVLVETLLGFARHPRQKTDMPGHATLSY